MLSDRLITLSTHLFIQFARMLLEPRRDRLVSVILGPFSPAHFPLAVGQVRWFARARCLGDQIAGS